MKKIMFFALMMLSYALAFAQDGFNYKILLSQGNTPLTNQAVVLRLTLKDGSTTVYRETHNLTTDANGIASVVIGTGTPLSGSFSGINWSHAISLQTEASTDGGSTFTDFGTTALQYVPYAKYAEKSANSYVFLNMSDQPATLPTEVIKHPGMVILGDAFSPAGTPPISETEIYKTFDGGSPAAAVSAFINGTSDQSRFGIYTQTLGTGAGSQYGSYHYLNTPGDGANYGVSVRNIGGGNGNHYAFYGLTGGNGQGNQYGLYNFMSNGGDGNHYGVYNQMIGAGHGIHYGMFNSMTTPNNQQIAIRDSIVSSSTDQLQLGMDNYIKAPLSYGIRNRITHLGGMVSVGVDNEIVADSSAWIVFGTYNDLSGDGDALVRMGTNNYISGAGGGDKYGTYNVIDSLAGGNHYAVYGKAKKIGSYAGYFDGDAYVSQKLKSEVAGDADLKAYIYGEINSVGAKLNGTDGYTVEHPSTGVYKIIFDTPMNSYRDYLVVSTIRMGGIGFISADKYAGYFYIRTYDTSGNLTNQAFDFVVYKK